ncbi:MAG: twin-arginine translocase TatA/TatE family subunit [Bacteroidota bacterium]
MNLSVVLFLESLGGGEVMVILLFILMFFGSEKIPGIARGLGKGIREVKDAMNGVQDELKGGLREAEKEVNKIKGDVTKDLPDTNDIVKYTLESEPLAQPKSSTVVMPVVEEVKEIKEDNTEGKEG